MVGLIGDIFYSFSFFYNFQTFYSEFFYTSEIKSWGSNIQFSSVAQSCSTLRPHEPQDTRPPCPSPTPRVYLNSCPLSRWCHLTISSCRPLLLPSIFPSIRVFSNESVLHIRWWKYWSFSFNISPSNEQSGLVSFRMDSLNLLAIQGTLKSLFQHHSSKYQFFGVQHFYTPTLISVHVTGEA